MATLDFSPFSRAEFPLPGNKHLASRKQKSFSVSLKTLDRTNFLGTRCYGSNELEKDSKKGTAQEEEVNDLGVRAALSMLKFYKREISPLLPSSCRYVPTCSEYSMIAYKKYGVAKGTILTAWRLCRCNPFGGSGFDPPRWFNESSPSEE